MTDPVEAASARTASVRALTASLVVGAGAALGALGRWAISAWAGPPDGPGATTVAATLGDNPGVTLVINLMGCLCLGALPALAAVRRHRLLELALGPGFLGGFTTVSAWAHETRTLAADGQVALAGAYVAITVAGCLGAAALGRAGAGRLTRQLVADVA